jgi:HEAT repeat protein
MKTWILNAALFISASSALAAGPADQALPAGATVQTLSISTAPAVILSSAPAAPVAVDTRTNTEKLSDPNPMIRRNAVVYIGSGRNKSSFPSLSKMLGDTSPEVRRAAVNALVGLDDPRTVKALMDKLGFEQDVSVRMNIVVAFGDIKSSSTVPVLLTLLKNPYPQFRGEAVRALGKINAPETYPAIVEMLNDEAEGVRMMTADVTSGLKLTAALPLLIKNLSDPVPMVRRSCAQALGVIGDPSAIPALKRIQNDPDMSVRAPALEAIEKLKKIESLPVQPIILSSGTK